MKAFLELGGSESIALKGALLLYEGRNRAFSVWHDAKPGRNECPQIGEGHALTTDFVRSLNQGLRAEMKPEVLPDCVLVWNSDLVVWWSGRCTRRMFFRNSSEAPTGLSGAEFPQPPLLWCASGQELTVRAVFANRRPTADTPLMIAPYWNVDGDTGGVCLGSMKVPELAGVAALAQWEKAFFESEFTHQTGVKRLVQGPKGYFDVWEQVRSGPRAFPSKCLVPSNETLSDLIRRCS
jgi:PRTRC genetic system protein B